MYNTDITSTNSVYLEGGGETMNTADMLKELRGDKSQAEIASSVGVTKSSWAMYERGERVPRDEVKVKIAKYFGKSVQEIFYPAM